MYIGIPQNTMPQVKHCLVYGITGPQRELKSGRGANFDGKNVSMAQHTERCFIA